jgi:hypothetical protein
MQRQKPYNPNAENSQAALLLLKLGSVLQPLRERLLQKPSSVPKPFRERLLQKPNSVFNRLRKRLPQKPSSVSKPLRERLLQSARNERIDYQRHLQDSKNYFFFGARAL